MTCKSGEVAQSQCRAMLAVVARLNVADVSSGLVSSMHVSFLGTESCSKMIEIEMIFSGITVVLAGPGTRYPGNSHLLVMPTPLSTCVCSSYIC